jgi:hypothetical protein
MTAVHITRAAAVTAALAMAMAPPISQAATGYAAPAPLESRANGQAVRAAEDFTAVIFPAKEHPGSRFVGHKPELNPEKTRDTNLAGALTAQGGGATTFYPDDMGYYGGPVVQSASQVNFYWANNAGGAWGNPAGYQTDLNVSGMMSLLTQYTFQSQGAGHWPVAGYYWYSANGGPGPLVYDSQVASQVRAIATADRTAGRQHLGMSTIYHVFLPLGTDECFDNLANGCYNPDGRAPGPFYYCGYHSATKLSDGTVVLYTVEPYESVNGCSMGLGLTNDTSNVLGHEIAELISDPMPGTGWVGKWADNGGAEIGDECAWTAIQQQLNGHAYITQDWYSNRYHNCDNAY